ncbi:hypothetical protein JCGZ_20092 [Jatropha curcas]|uniref:Disease resistance N-terminal domain-containing protein n=1 Tax=Jatropha curcas TaxID=180498 RepID=A0A067K6V9_JATCU|nr:hypothetical protein JCGZ_20092 [Jatropha curcas]
MAEAYLSSIVGGLISNLASPALRDAKLWWGVTDELDKLKTTVSTIQAVILGAEKQYSQSHEVKVWVDSLKEAFYDVDDLLDELSTKELQEELLTSKNLGKKARGRNIDLLLRCESNCRNEVTHNIDLLLWIKSLYLF